MPKLAAAGASSSNGLYGIGGNNKELTLDQNALNVIRADGVVDAVIQHRSLPTFQPPG
jgi:hypothetical protein